MSCSNDIKELLTIKDDNIFISKVESRKVNHTQVKIIHATLTYEIVQCPLCNGSAFVDHKKMIVKNGTKSSHILLSGSMLHKTVLKLRKQRFHCRHCQCHFTCETSIVDRYCFISKQVKFSILENLAESQSASSIAKRHYVSWSTVQRVIQSLESMLKRHKEWLPTCLMVDEFRSLKGMDGKMSFICADGDTGELLDVLPSRRLQYISEYFLSYTYEARKRVKFIVTDMNAPYFELVKRCFPNAAFIVDRFHIVQHLNRCFDKVRVRIMKSLDRNNPIQARQYNQLKSLFKLLLKHPDKLDYSTFEKRRNFRWSCLTETEIVQRLLSISSELKTAYTYYQSLLDSFRKKDSKTFFNLINQMPSNIPNELKHIKSAFTKYRAGITLAMNLSYSNGKIECKNTHIKTLKRVCYGFRSFTNMKVRIFLMNNLICFNEYPKTEKSVNMIA